ncbi:MAG: esterase/lipase family protein [Nitrospirota bacterium]
MKLDIVAYEGEAGKPVVVFIHGLGMDKDIWINPSASKILGGMFPLKVLLKRYAAEGDHGTLRTLFDIVRQKGYTVVTWSQKRPAGTIGPAVLELQEVVRIVCGKDQGPIFLIGHSRGGLVARKYLSTTDRPVRALITLSTPHHGSSIAGLARHVAPIASLLAPVIPKGEKGTLRFALRRVLEFLRSRALREILPGSAFFKSLDDKPGDGIYSVSFGGTSPSLFTLSGVAVPDIFEKIVPAGLFPEEMKPGKGDGLVSAESSKLPWCHEHHLFALNHAEILFDEGVHDRVVGIIEDIARG